MIKPTRAEVALMVGGALMLSLGIGVLSQIGDARAQAGGMVPNYGWFNVIHQPAAATAAVASKAAGGALIKHVATVCAVYVSTVAAQPDIVINLRDGATGAGTILWTGRVSCAITSGDVCKAVSPPLNAVGTANTAMTCETATAPAATNLAVATLHGYDTH